MHPRFELRVDTLSFLIADPSLSAGYAAQMARFGHLGLLPFAATLTAAFDETPPDDGFVDLSDDDDSDEPSSVGCWACHGTGASMHGPCGDCDGRGVFAQTRFDDDCDGAL